MAAYRCARERLLVSDSTDAAANPSRRLMVAFDHQRASPTYGKAASTNSLVGSDTRPRSRLCQASREPIHVSSSVTIALGVRTMPHARAADESAPLACVAAEAGLLRSLSLTLFGFFTSSRPEHPAAAATKSSAVTRVVFMASLSFPGTGQKLKRTEN